MTEIDDKVRIRRSEERGRADHGWLKAYHSFSFGDYHDPKFMHFRSMRVLNEDRIEPAQGFPMHPHQDMEIVTYILKGALKHEDNMGNAAIIRAGEVQKMTAGSGVMHSEFNASEKEQTHLFQIWIIPRNKGLAPAYEQKSIPHASKLNQLCLIASGEQEGLISIDQDVRIYASILKKGMDITHRTSSSRYLWLQLATGTLEVNSQKISEGDAIALSSTEELRISAAEESEFLVFDLS